MKPNQIYKKNNSNSGIFSLDLKPHTLEVGRFQERIRTKI